jgi:hypothetical protein
MRLLDRQAYKHASRAWIATLDTNIAPVFLYHSLRGVQAETKTLAGRSSGEEWFKNPIAQGFSDSVPIVPDFDKDRLAGPIGTYINATHWRARVRRSLPDYLEMAGIRKHQL